MNSPLTRAGRPLAALALALATGGLAACDKDSDMGMDDLGKQETTTATQAPEPDETPEYSGPYDAKFRAWINDHDDADVTVAGTIEKVVSENAFTLAGEGNTEDLLVVGSTSTNMGLTEGTEVSVTGEVHKAFNLPEVEDDIDVDFEDDAVFQGFDRDPYVRATEVSAAAGAPE